MTKQMTVDEAIEFYDDYELDMVQYSGGYPACVAELDGVVAIADETPENGPELELWMADAFIDWMMDAKRYYRKFNCDLSEAVNETRVQPSLRIDH